MDQELIKLYQQAVMLLIEKGTDYWEAQRSIMALDGYVVAEIAESLISRVKEDSYDRLEKFLATKPSPEQMSLYLGITQEEFDKLHLNKFKESLIKIQLSMKFSAAT